MLPPCLRLALLAAAVALVVVALGLGEAATTVAAQETRHAIRGAVFGPDGEPASGVEIGVWVPSGRDEGVYTWESVRTEADGSFRLLLGDGSYRLDVLSDRYGHCTVHGPEIPEGAARAVLSVEGSGSSSIRIVLSAPVSRERAARTPCYFDVPLHRIEGVVTGSDGEPLEGITVRAHGGSVRDSQPTTAAGTFALEVPAGSYFLELIAVSDGQDCSLGWAGLEGKHSLRRLTVTLDSGRLILIDGAGVEAIGVRLPEKPADLCREIRGLVADATGQPLGDVAVGANGLGRLVMRDARTRTTRYGSFSFRGPQGFYQFSVHTAAGSACAVAGVENPHTGASTGVAVAAAMSPGLRLVVSGPASPTAEWLTCWFPPETVTTELRPGWNLAGWTEAESDVSAIFDDIPALKAAYSWDTGTGSFREAVGDGSSGPESLSTLQTGMGLWLYLGGEEAFTWRRPFLPESGLVSLSEGWNLVAWLGEDTPGAKDAVASLGTELRAAATWDPVAGGFDFYSPLAPTHAASPWPVTRGGAVWVNASVARRWYQPGSFQPPLQYAHEVSAETRTWLAAATQSVVGYFAERMGVIATAVRFYVGDIAPCGVFVHPTVVMTERCVDAASHEYGHAIQLQVAGAGGRQGPAWLTEGVADRWRGQYEDHVGDRTYGDRRNDNLLPETRRTETPLARMDTYDEVSYAVANLAVDWLVQLTGDDSILEYYRQRFSYPAWEEAFEDVFGLGVTEFYSSFEAHRAEVAPPLPAIEGVLTGADGEPASGVEIGAWVHGDGPGENVHVWTDGDGSFRLPLGDGTYSLQVVSDRYGLCTVHGPEIPEGAARAVLSVEGSGSSSIRIVLSAPVSRERAAWTPCYFDVPLHWIEGVLTGADGEPASGVEIGAWVHGDGPGENVHVWTEGDGSFRLPLGDGTYSLQVVSDRYGLCTVHGPEIPEGAARAVLSVEGSGSSSIRIVLSAPVSRDQAAWIACES